MLFGILKNDAKKKMKILLDGKYFFDPLEQRNFLLIGQKKKEGDRFDRFPNLNRKTNKLKVQEGLMSTWPKSEHFRWPWLKSFCTTTKVWTKF